MSIQWSKKHDDRLDKFEKLIHREMELNKRASSYYADRVPWFGYPNIIIGSIVTFSIFINIKEDYMRYINGALTMITTILAGLNKWLGYEKKMNMHKNTEIAYEVLVRDIDQQKDLEYKDRVPVSEFMKSLKDKFMSLKRGSPSIPQNIEKEFNEGFDKFIELLKASGEISESSEEEKMLIEKKTVKVFNETTGEHELTEIIIEKSGKSGKSGVKMSSIEKQIDSLTNNDFCNKSL
jgi:hypothetical protein